MDKKTALMEYIKNDIMHDRNAKLSEDQDLLNSGILDSLGILQIVAFVDRQFDIQVPDEDVVFENFESVSALSDYLDRLVNS